MKNRITINGKTYESDGPIQVIEGDAMAMTDAEGRKMMASASDGSTVVQVQGDGPGQGEEDEATKWLRKARERLEGNNLLGALVHARMAADLFGKTHRWDRAAEVYELCAAIAKRKAKP